MKNYKLEDFKKGWFIGNFEPSVFNGDFEVGIKEYKSGDKEERHLHKLSKEYTVIVSGRVKMNNIEYTKGDIIEIVENEDTDFECVEDTITVVVKTRSIKNDKYKI